MRVVIDTNIVISASIWKGKPGLVFDRVVRKLDILLVTDAIVAEIEEKCRDPKFSKFRALLNATLIHVKEFGQTPRTAYPVSGICRDADDDIYLECALSGQADYIVTGDTDLLILKEYRGIEIVNASQYLEIVNPESKL
jgi:putative PIN family toxin of toxin-antitoxin system